MDDSTIVQMFWDRDENAISVTSDKYGPYCFAIARNILGSLELHSDESTDTVVGVSWENSQESFVEPL